MSDSPNDDAGITRVDPVARESLTKCTPLVDSLTSSDWSSIQMAFAASRGMPLPSNAAKLFPAVTTASGMSPSGRGARAVVRDGGAGASRAGTAKVALVPRHHGLRPGARAEAPRRPPLFAALGSADRLVPGDRSAAVLHSLGSAWSKDVQTLVDGAGRDSRFGKGRHLPAVYCTRLDAWLVAHGILAPSSASPTR